MQHSINSNKACNNLCSINVKINYTFDSQINEPIHKYKTKKKFEGEKSLNKYCKK